VAFFTSKNYKLKEKIMLQRKYNSVLASEMLVNSNTGKGIGYERGAGRQVTQVTNRATGVTINSLTGQITTDNTSLAAEGSATFIVTNSKVKINDVIALSIQSGAVGVGTMATVSTVTDGSFSIRIHNGNVAAGTAETGALIINFVVLKGASL
jgi:hypothetical protein